MGWVVALTMSVAILAVMVYDYLVYLFAPIAVRTKLWQLMKSREDEFVRLGVPDKVNSFHPIVGVKKRRLYWRYEVNIDSSVGIGYEVILYSPISKDAYALTFEEDRNSLCAELLKLTNELAPLEWRNIVIFALGANHEMLSEYNPPCYGPEFTSRLGNRVYVYKVSETGILREGNPNQTAAGDQ